MASSTTTVDQQFSKASNTFAVELYLVKNFEEFFSGNFTKFFHVTTESNRRQIWKCDYFTRFGTFRTDSDYDGC
jgi:hypothetical protein